MIPQLASVHLVTLPEWIADLCQAHPHADLVVHHTYLPVVAYTEQLAKDEADTSAWSVTHQKLLCNIGEMDHEVLLQQTEMAFLNESQAGAILATISQLWAHK